MPALLKVMAGKRSPFSNLPSQINDVEECIGQFTAGSVVIRQNTASENYTLFYRAAMSAPDPNARSRSYILVHVCSILHVYIVIPANGFELHGFIFILLLLHYDRIFSSA